MVEHKNLQEALAAFQAEVPTVAKSKTAKVKTKTGSEYSYSYADLADVSAAALPLLAKHGLAFSALPRGTAAGGYELAGTLMHVSGDEKEGTLPLSGQTPQELGSSITYMRRYLLGCLTGIVTDDDDDGQAASGSQRSAQPAAGGAGRPQAAAVNANGNGERPATAKQKGLIFARADEKRLANSRLANVVLSATGNDGREFESEDAAGEWLKRSLDRLPAARVDVVLEGIAGA